MTSDICHREEPRATWRSQATCWRLPRSLRSLAMTYAFKFTANILPGTDIFTRIDRVFISLSVILFVLCLSGFVSVQAAGLGFKSLLKVNEQMKYQHWNIEKKEVTGFTAVQVIKTLVGGTRHLLVINRNEDENGKLYLEKKSWFEVSTGKLNRYTERDLRLEVEVTNTYAEDKISTRIKRKTEVKNLSIDTEEELVPFEVLTLYLRREIPRLIKEQEIEFVLYLPIIASELDKKGLPLSFSKLRMIARVESIDETQSVLGRVKAVKVLVTPGSLLLSAMLPKDKSEFRFVFGFQTPHYLLSFEEGETRSVLVEVKHLTK